MDRLNEGNEVEDHFNRAVLESRSELWFDEDSASIVVKVMVHIGMSSEICHWNPSELLDMKNQCMAYAVLILNRPITITSEYMLSLWNTATVHVTVDGGTNHWYAFTEKELSQKCAMPDIITGDLDSVYPEVLAHYQAKDVEVIRTPDQNETDFTKALRQIIAFVRKKEIKLDAIIAVVESSGRLDQIVGNINTLYKAESIVGEIPLFLLGKNSLSWRLAPGSHEITVPQSVVSSHKWCSLIPFGSPSRVTTTGLKWNLDDRVMEFGKVVSTSNTYSGSSVVTVTTDNSLLWSMALNIGDKDGEDDDD